MIEKRLKNIWKLSVLIGVRQGFFLGRNIYELYYQPYLTIKEIIDKRDKSQIFLVAVAAITPTIAYILARIVWDLAKYHQILPMTGRVFLLAAGIQAAVLVYLGYWTLEVLKKNGNS